MGSRYTIIFNSADLEENVVGQIEPHKRVIKISKDTKHDLPATLRHEIIHAFLFESGLWVNSNSVECWAMNEEMIDWIAIQYPKISKVFKKLDIEN